MESILKGHLRRRLAYVLVPMIGEPLLTKIMRCREKSKDRTVYVGIFLLSVQNGLLLVICARKP
jgi:hypothetical protein